MAKRRASHEDDDDVGFRTPTKREVKRKKETGRTRRDRGREREEAAPAERPDKKKADKKKETGRAPRREREPAPAAPPTASKAAAPAASAGAPAVPRKAVPLLAGLGAALLLGVALLALLKGGTPPPPPETTAITPVQATHSATSDPATPAPPERPIERPTPAVTPVEPPPIEQPAEVEAPDGAPKDPLEELAGRSATHAEVARILDEYTALFDERALRDPGPGFENFLERRRKEEELLERVRAMGPLAVDALSDMLLGLDHRQYRLFLGKALAGIEGPDALAAVGNILGQVKDVSLQTTMVRYLPQTAEAADLVGAAFQGEEDANLRTLLMREYAQRLGDDLSRGGDMFRDTAQNDPDPNVRAEAVTILGKRGDPADQQLLEGIITSESNLAIRQRAIDSYGATAKEAGLPFLESILRDPDSSRNVRASAVLAIGKAGGDQALATLDVVAQTDPDPEIRRRADNMARSLRRAKEQNPEDRVDDPPPIQVGPGQPIERN